MTVIAGASAGIRDMADGSLRITVEFEPKDAKAAFELFGSRGTPVAMAALKAGYAAVPAEPAAEKPKVGPLCREAVQLCQMPEFQKWAVLETGEEPSEAGAKEFLTFICTIDSRKELDSDPHAAEMFRSRIRTPFMRYMKTRSEPQREAA